jgi:cytochrome c oxidase assembly protein subunit 15
MVHRYLAGCLGAAIPTLAILARRMQITLGGWTSTHYAALACTGFPTCHADSWWPEADFGETFVLW